MPIRLEYRKYYDVRWRKFRLTAWKPLAMCASAAGRRTGC